MKILIDGDGCPVIEDTTRIAKEHSLDLIIVTNYAHIIDNDYASVVTVDLSRDSADYYIVNHCEKGDIVITQDHGLAAMALSKGAYCINQNGLIISDKNIDSLLNRRHLNMELRKQRIYNSKFKKRTKEFSKSFEKGLLYLLNIQGHTS